MDSPHLGIPAHPPEQWAARTSCDCTEPRPQQLAERKGAARTICAKCGLPTKIKFQR